jgi:hypothetical protein
MNSLLIKWENSVLIMQLQKDKVSETIPTTIQVHTFLHFLAHTLHPALIHIDYVGTKLNLWQSRFANTPGNLHPLRPLSLPAVSLFYPPKPSVTMQYPACSI